MRRTVFEESMIDIFAAFGKRPPVGKPLEAIWDRVEKLPDDFMFYAAARLRDEEKLPMNLGRALARDIWPDFLDANPDKRATATPTGCQRCLASMPGFIRVWKDGKAYTFRCLCNPDSKSQLPAPTDWQLQEAGFSWQAPKPKTGFGKSLVAMMVHADMTPRKEHVEYLETCELDF